MEDGGTSTDPSAPQSDPCSGRVKRQRLFGLDPEDELMAEVSLEGRCLFAEFFAGTGVLTSAVSSVGVPVRGPDDVALGGYDFQYSDTVLELRREFGELAASGVQLMVHFAPPCSTFSRVRSRSKVTKLRTDEFPQGPPQED